MEIPKITGSFEERIVGFKNIIDNSNKIVFFGGAGTSTDCGIKDFRSEDGLYNKKNKYKYSPEYMLSKSFFNSKPKDFYEFYKEEFNVLDINPNITHYTLVDLENEGKLSAIITQNIDGLHQKAGSKKVIELHGTIYENYCVKCHKHNNKSENYSADYIFKADGIPRCPICGHIVRPNVVFYDEMLNNKVIKESISVLEKADTLIIAGTSLTVNPAASFIYNFYGENIIIINKSETDYDKYCNIIFRENISDVFAGLNKLK